MKLQELHQLNSLLKKWKNEYPFCVVHNTTVDLMILYTDNLIKTKIKNKELE